MNLDKFNSLPLPSQNCFEWRTYLEFIETYFKARNIETPTVVEIGIYKGMQKRFYEELLGFRHIGIDRYGDYKPDVLGESQSSETLIRLTATLAGSSINILFIDGDHDYSSVKRDFEIYSPLVKNIIAFHDIYFYPGVELFWRELKEKNNEGHRWTFLSIGSWDSPTKMVGIGLAIKENPKEFGEGL